MRGKTEKSPVVLFIVQMGLLKTADPDILFLHDMVL